MKGDPELALSVSNACQAGYAFKLDKQTPITCRFSKKTQVKVAKNTIYQACGLITVFKGKKKRKERNQAPYVGVRILKSNWCPPRRQMQTMKMFKAERKRAIIQRPGPPPGGGGGRYTQKWPIRGGSGFRYLKG